MGINIFAPIHSSLTHPEDEQHIVNQANQKAKGRFDWCELFRGPGGHRLTLTQALNFEDEAAPYYILSKGRMHAVKDRSHWQHMLKQSGCDTVLFIKARG